MTEHRLSLSALAQSLIDGDHSIFSASGSHLWMHCAGGLIANILAKDKPSPEAAEGTVAHGVGELWLRMKKRPSHLVGTKQTIDGFEIEITDEMLNHVEVYFDWCSWLPGQHYIETKVYYTEITPIPKQGGTADHVACSYQHMVITDLKYGKGVQVFAKDNTQALLYALGFFYAWDWLYDFQTIELRICQPRLDHLDTWTITRAELLEFADRAKVRAYLAWQLDAPRTPGEKQCSFCKVKADCGAHFYWQAELTSGAWVGLIEPVTVEQVQELKDRIEFQQIANLVAVHTLTTEEMSQLYRYRHTFESWWKALHNELNIRAARGEKIPGMKLVESRSNRVVRDPNLVADTLLLDYGITDNELIVEEMISPAKIEKLLRKHGVRPKDLASVLDPLVYKPAGKPTLVSDTDRRPAIVDFSEIAFRDLDLETENPESEDHNG